MHHGQSMDIRPAEPQSSLIAPADAPQCPTCISCYLLVLGSLGLIVHCLSPSSDLRWCLFSVYGFHVPPLRLVEFNKKQTNNQLHHAHRFLQKAPVPLVCISSPPGMQQADEAARAHCRLRREAQSLCHLPVDCIFASTSCWLEQLKRTQYRCGVIAQ
jgi:hypothetical protein